MAEPGAGWHIVSPRTLRTVHRVRGGAYRGFVYGNEDPVGDINGDGIADFISREYFGEIRVRFGTPLLASERNQVWGHSIVIPGEVFKCRVYGAAPGHIVRMLGSRAGVGNTFVGRLGIHLDLGTPIKVLGEAVSDSNSIAAFYWRVPESAPEGYIWLQAISINDQTRGPLTSNVYDLYVVKRW